MVEARRGWNQILFSHREQWPVTHDGVGPLKFGMSREEIEALLGKPLRAGLVEDDRFSLHYHGALIGDWPLLTYPRADDEAAREVLTKTLKETPWYDGAHADRLQPGLQLILEPDHGLSAAHFCVFDVSPSIFKRAILGSTKHEIVTASGRRPEKRQLALLDQADDVLGQKGIEVPPFGLAVGSTNAEHHVIPRALVYCPRFEQEAVRGIMEAKAASKAALGRFLKEPEFEFFRRESHRLKDLKRGEPGPVALRLLLWDEDEAGTGAGDEGDGGDEDAPICLLEYGDLSVWSCVEAPGSGVRVLHVRSLAEDVNAAPSSRPIVRAMRIDSGAGKIEWPRDGDAGFRGALVRKARSALPEEKRKPMLARALFERPAVPVPVPCKVGGWPDWLQLDETPSCPRCASTKNMELIVQVGSTARWAYDGDGAIYVFACRVHPGVRAVVAQSL